MPGSSSAISASAKLASKGKKGKSRHIPLWIGRIVVIIKKRTIKANTHASHTICHRIPPIVQRVGPETALRPRSLMARIHTAGHPHGRRSSHHDNQAWAQIIHQDSIESADLLVVHGILLDPCCVPTSELLLQSCVRVRPRSDGSFQPGGREEVSETRNTAKCSDKLFSLVSVTILPVLVMRGSMTGNGAAEGQ